LFTSERYPQGREKQAVRTASAAIVSREDTCDMSRTKILVLQACMLEPLIEYAFCGIHSPRDLIT
jgi:hypothetical protein